MTIWTDVIVALVFAVLIPFIAMRMLVPSLKEHAPSMHNFRGNKVYNGLGVVWIIWAISLFLAYSLQAIGLYGSILLSLLQLPLILIIGCCAFGMFDDWAGDSSAKGFKGHVKALIHGRFTTGGLKMIGIGLLSFAIALQVKSFTETAVIDVILATCVIALSANLMNLFDLRPGRACKVYVFGLAIAIFLLFVCSTEFCLMLTPAQKLLIFVAGIGPVIAILKYDLNEEGMLGDSGANPMGALIGVLLVLELPTIGLAIALVILVALNLLSEKVSFSKLIAGNKVLNAIDMLGRKK